MQKFQVRILAKENAVFKGGLDFELTTTIAIDIRVLHSRKKL